MKYIIGIFNEWLTRAAGIIFLMMLGLAIFSVTSRVPYDYPLIGMFIFALVPIMFAVGGMVFFLAILKYSDREE